MLAGEIINEIEVGLSFCLPQRTMLAMKIFGERSKSARAFACHSGTVLAGERFGRDQSRHKLLLAGWNIFEAKSGQALACYSKDCNAREVSLSW